MVDRRAEPRPERGAASSGWHEITDVLLYLLQLADKLGIDPLAAAREKLAINATQYPVELAKGTSRKYTEL